MRDRSDLYYECHVTIEPVTDDNKRAALFRISKAHEFRISTFLLKQDHAETPDEFISCRDESYARIVQRCIDVCVSLKSSGMKIKRYKIEDTLLDSNRKTDPLGLLT